MPDYRLAAERAARKYGITPSIFLAMIKAESNFDPNADSGQARGIAQFTPGTARAYGVNLNDGLVTDDLEGSARYLRDNLKRTGGNYRQALSIYNSGRPNTYLNPGFANGQTYNYVRKIFATRDQFAGRDRGSSRGPAPARGGAPSSGGTPSGTRSRQVTDPSTRSFDPGTASTGLGLSGLIEASLSSQRQQAPPPMMLANPSFSASKYVNAVLPSVGGAMVKPKLDIGAAISALEAAPAAAEVQTMPGKTRTVTTRTPGRPGTPGPRGNPKPGGLDGSVKFKGSGGFGGSKGIADQFKAIAGGLGVQVTSSKRQNSNPFSGKGSDHDHGNKDAYAYDLSDGSAPTENMDRTAFRIMRSLGFKNYQMGQPVNASQGVVVKNGYRIQMIYRGTGRAFGGNHLNHVHVGVKRVG